MSEYPERKKQIFDFEPCRPMSLAAAVERVTAMEPEKAIGLIVFYLSIGYSADVRILKELRNLSANLNNEPLLKLVTAAHYNNLAMEINLSDLRATFGPETDPAVIAAVTKMAGLAQSMRDAIDETRPFAMRAATSDVAKAEILHDHNVSAAAEAIARVFTEASGS